jgi:hypothetical protein
MPCPYNHDPSESDIGDDRDSVFTESATSQPAAMVNARPDGVDTGSPYTWYDLLALLCGALATRHLVRDESSVLERARIAGEPNL